MGKKTTLGQNAEPKTPMPKSWTALKKNKR